MYYIISEKVASATNLHTHIALIQMGHINQITAQHFSNNSRNLPWMCNFVKSIGQKYECTLYLPSTLPTSPHLPANRHTTLANK